jgi:hypothetical protein
MRLEEHPGIIVRDGPSGPRAVLIGGPDVWEVVRVVKSARAAEPGLDADAVVRLAAETMGLSPDRMRVALETTGRPVPARSRTRSAKPRRPSGPSRNFG